VIRRLKEVIHRSRAEDSFAGAASLSLSEAVSVPQPDTHAAQTLAAQTLEFFQHRPLGF
jgi:hypothetical protein